MNDSPTSPTIAAAPAQTPTPRDAARPLRVIPTAPAAKNLLGDAPIGMAVTESGDVLTEDGCPAYLDVCDHLEDVLDVLGPLPADTTPPTITMRCTNLPKETQRHVFQRLLTWDTAHAVTPDNGGNRVLVAFHNRPQLRVEFLAQAVGAQHFELVQVARWHIDRKLLPDTGKAES